MIAFSFVLAFLLSLTFAASTIGKFRDVDLGLPAFVALRLDAPAPRVTAIIVIAFEALIATGLLLTTGWSFVVISGAAVMVTTGLLVAVIRAHALGSKESCACFGGWLPSRIGPALIVRNSILVIVAALLTAVAFVLAVHGLMGGVPGAIALLLAGNQAPIWAFAGSALTAAFTWTTARAIESYTNDTQPPSEPGSGSLLLPSSATVVDVLAPAARSRLLLFTLPGCHACAASLELLRTEQARLDRVVDMYIIQGVMAGSIPTQADVSDPNTLRSAVDVGGALARQLGVGLARPVGVLVSTKGEQVGPIALGSDKVEELVSVLLSAVDSFESAESTHLPVNDESARVSADQSIDPTPTRADRSR